MKHYRHLLMSKIGRNCLDGASGNALFANDAVRSRKVKLEGLGIETQGCCWAYSSTKTAMNAKIVVNHDFTAGEGNADVLRSHPVERCIKLIDVSR